VVVGVDADDDLMADMSVDPVLSPVSSPLPGSPVSFSVCPLRLGKTFAVSSTDMDASSAEAFIQRQQQQVGRIAEYNKPTSLLAAAHVSIVFTVVSCQHCYCLMSCYILTKVTPSEKLTKLAIIFVPSANCAFHLEN